MKFLIVLLYLSAAAAVSEDAFKNTPVVMWHGMGTKWAEAIMIIL